VKEPRPETTTIELLSTLKLDTEDVLLTTRRSWTAISTEDQTNMTSALKLMSNAQELHHHHTLDLHSIELVQNSLSAETHTPVMSGEKLAMVNGDHLLLTTSGITTTELDLFAETLCIIQVLLLELEDHKIKSSSIPKLVTEDVLLTTTRLWNAINTEDQTKVICLHKLTLDVLEHLPIQMVNWIQDTV
jgi:hypothetical protein